MKIGEANYLGAANHQGEGFTFNSDRAYAVRFDSVAKAITAMKKIPADYLVEAA